MNHITTKIRNDLIPELINDLINLNKKYKLTKIYLEDSYFEIYYDNTIYKLSVIEENNIILLSLNSDNNNIILKIKYNHNNKCNSLNKIFQTITRRKN